MNYFEPPHLITKQPNQVSVFLAGTIDMGNSIDWQLEVSQRLDNAYKSRIVVLNPRRKDWNSSWETKYTNAQFFQQVSWELNAMEAADLIIMNFLPTSQSPITLLELGLYARSGKLFVLCNQDYYRSGNVHVVCDRYKTPIYYNMDSLLSEIHPVITKKLQNEVFL
jgi:hypothetical protein